MSMNLDLAEKYAVLIKNLAFLASCGNYVTENLFFALTNARRDFGDESTVATAQCIQTLSYALQDVGDPDASVIYNAILHWAIKDLQQQ